MVSVVWALRSRVRVLVDVFEVLRLPQAHQLLLISCYQWPFVTFKSDVVAFSSPCKQGLASGLEGYPVQYVLSHTARG